MSPQQHERRLRKQLLTGAALGFLATVTELTMYHHKHWGGAPLDVERLIARAQRDRTDIVTAYWAVWGKRLKQRQREKRRGR